MGAGETGAQFYQEARGVIALYPDQRSAVMPVLRLAQERHGGWLPREAFEEAAEALGYTPAYCQSVASFYDMFHLGPIGRHTIAVCTNICCGLRGAQAVLETFESELGIHAGETTDDGEITLRAVECLGGCGWPTVVAVDHRYRQNVGAGGVAAIVEELRGA